MRHGLVGLVTSAVMISALTIGPPSGRWDRLSIVSAYVCLILYAWTLVTGPIRVLRKRPPQLNVYLRRDIGIWAAISGLLHLLIGTDVAMSPVYLGKFVTGPDGFADAEMRSSLFSWGSVTGFVAGLIFLLLLALSNDYVLRWLGPKWWKRLQRSSYTAFFLFVLHGYAFQALERRAWPLVGTLVAVTVAVLWSQIRGARATRNARAIAKPHLRPDPR
jgi:sulfoxide reductase heme-binding subunit YedZ